MKKLFVFTSITILFLVLNSFNNSNKIELASPSAADSSLLVYLKFDSNYVNSGILNISVEEIGEPVFYKGISDRKKTAIGLYEESYLKITSKDFEKLKSQNLTISVWAKISSIPFTFTYTGCQLVDLSGLGVNWAINPNSGYEMPGGWASLLPFDPVKKNFPFCEGRAKSRIGEWQLITITFDGEYHNFYIDDNLVSRRSYRKSKINFSDDDYLLIGARQTKEIIQHFNGRIDELRIYNRAITIQEIDKLLEAKN